jgi:anti-sigma factor RsiW
MTRCADVETLMEHRIDGTAGPAENARLDAHLAACPDCAAVLAEEMAIDEALAAHLGGAKPSTAFDAAVRQRIRGERQPVGGWIPDVLNAAGVLLVLVGAVPVALGWNGVTGVVVAATALAVGLYPLLLATWASEAEPGDPDPAP